MRQLHNKNHSWLSALINCSLMEREIIEKVYWRNSCRNRTKNLYFKVGALSTAQINFHSENNAEAKFFKMFTSVAADFSVLKSS